MPTNQEIEKQVKFRKYTYIILFGALLVLFLLLRTSNWQGSTQLHTIMEVVATLLAGIVGILTYVRFRSRKDNTLLFIATAFIGTSMLDGYHTIVTSSVFAGLFPSVPSSLIPWSWNASRNFLALLLFLSWWAWRRETRLGDKGRISERSVYITVGLLTLGSFIFFAFFPLPRAYYPEFFFGRPEEFISAGLFLGALIGYLKKGYWKQSHFEHWLVISILIGFMGQTIFMSSSFQLFDMMFDSAHLLKKMSYIAVLIGSIISIAHLFRSEEKHKEELEEEIINRKKTEAALISSEMEYRQLFDSSAVGNWSRDITVLRSKLDGIKSRGIKDLDEYLSKHPKEVHDIVGRMVLGEVNQTALDIFGAKSAEEIRKGFPKIFAKIPFKTIIGFLVTIAEGGRSWRMDIKCDTLDGRHIAIRNYSTIPAQDQVPQMMITNMIDITESKQHEEDLMKLASELKRSNEDLESYSYAVSHDLKTPLRTVRSFVSFLIEDYGEKLDKTGVDYLTRMKAAVTHMDNLIEDVLTLSRVGRKISDLEAIDTKKLFQEILLEIKETGSKAKISIPKELPIIQTQNAWIRPLFHNLINNGIKYNKSKLPTVKIEYQSSVGEHLFSVVDNGIGIEKKYFEKIFSLFERLHSRSDFEGTGAGLAICKKIVDNMGGKIWVESTLGEGSSFFVSLPKGNK